MAIEMFICHCGFQAGRYPGSEREYPYFGKTLFVPDKDAASFKEDMALPAGTICLEDYLKDSFLCPKCGTLSIIE